MGKVEAVVERIREAFGPNAHPGDVWLQGSNEGCEPFEVVEPFRGRSGWEGVEPELLDRYAEALSFFSEAGFRYFLPAFLIADLRGELQRAEPVFHLTNGFHEASVRVPVGEQVFTKRLGGAALMNPLRYGAMTSGDYARFRLSVFTREEAGAILAYLEHKRDADPDGWDAERIDAALDGFWRERARSAPTAEDLRQHLAEQDALMAAIRERSGGG